MKSLEIVSLFFGPAHRGTSDFAVDSRRLGTEIVFVPKRSRPIRTIPGDSMERSTISDAAWRAADQLPQTVVTMLAEGQVPSVTRRCASPPRRRACVRDQSYDDGSLPYRARHSRIAAITSSRVHVTSAALSFRSARIGRQGPPVRAEQVRQQGSAICTSGEQSGFRRCPD
jgi:hypothetical protein